MSQMPEWKRALQEPNAIGWVGLFMLVVIIGFGAFFVGGNNRSGGRPVAGNVAQAAK